MERWAPTIFFVSFALIILFCGDLWRSSENVSASTSSSIATFSADYPSLSLEVNIPAAELRLKENGQVIRRFQVAVGQPQYPTPIRRDYVTQLVWNPWWYPPDSAWAKNDKITPPGLKNPLGPVKMPLSDGVRMHGTTKDSSIGHAASHACIRMHNKDAKILGWLLQSDFSDSIDPALLEKYQKNGNTSFYVNLGRPIPIDLIYQSVEVEGKLIKLYPDWYHKMKDPKATLLKSLTAAGVDTEKISTEKIDALLKKWKDKVLEVPLEELLVPTNV